MSPKVARAGPVILSGSYPRLKTRYIITIVIKLSIIAEITGMDVANASLYDGATSLGEAALMCSRINKRNKFIIPTNISWDKRCVLRSYISGIGLRIKEVPYDSESGEIDIDILKKNIDENTTGVYIENPNFFGVFEEKVEEIKKIISDNKSLFIVGVNPISLGITKSPGDYGADIVVGEGRCLGNPIDFGGSSLGIFACKSEFILIFLGMSENKLLISFNLILLSIFFLTLELGMNFIEASCGGKTSFT